MSKFSSGKDSYAISDRSGFRYRYRDMRREWNGLLVGKDEFEQKQPQLEPFRKVFDAQALKDARPDRVEPEVARLLKRNPFLSGAIGSSVVTVNETEHERKTGDVERFRDVFGLDGITKTVIELSTGYAITVTNENEYTFVASSFGTAISGNTRGGGEFASVGPVTFSDTGEEPKAELVSLFIMTANGAILSTSTFDSINVTFDSASKTFDEA